MAKAQSFFGGTKLKITGVGVKQVGNFGDVKNFTGNIEFHETVKQTRPQEIGTEIPRKTRVKQVGPKGEQA